MKVWIWRDGEPLPTDADQPRLMRAGMLAQHLGAAGHDVLWFSSTFNHYQKQQRECGPGSFPVTERLRLEIVNGPGYSRNGSPYRFLHNKLVAKRSVERAHSVVAASGEYPDIMVMDMPMPEMALAGARLARDWSVPSVVCVRDLWPDFFQDFLSAPAKMVAAPLIRNIDNIVRAACSEATSLVGISPHYLDWGLAKAGRSKRATDAILPLGYSPEPIEHGNKRILSGLGAKGIDPARTLVVFVGSWGWTYDLSLVLDAAEALAHQPDIQFVIAGGGEQHSLIARRAEALPNVVCPGWLDRQEIAQLLNTAAVGLSPYRNVAPQGMPNKLFEYMSAGLIQITTLTGEAANLLEDNGLGVAVPPGDNDRFVAALVASLGTPETQERRSRIKAYFSKHFDAQGIYPAYVRHLESLAQKVTRQPRSNR